MHHIAIMLEIERKKKPPNKWFWADCEWEKHLQMWCIEIDKASHADVQVHTHTNAHAQAITYLNDNNHFRKRHSLSHMQWLHITIKNGSVYLSWPINLNVCFILTLALPEIVLCPILNALVGKSFNENQMVILLIKQHNKNVINVNGF